MKTFKTADGKAWDIRINVAAIKKVRDLVKVDLYAMLGEGFQSLAKLLNDPVTLVDVVYVLCKDQADKDGVTDEDFGRGMAGNVILDATNAFTEELVDFFPNPSVREQLRDALRKSKRVMDLMLAKTAKDLGEIDPEKEAAKIIATLESKSPSGNLPASSGSILDLSPSEN